MDTLIILHENIPDYNVFLKSIKHGFNIIKYDDNETQYEYLLNIKNITKLVIVWENGVFLTNDWFSNITNYNSNKLQLTWFNNAFTYLVECLSRNNPNLTIDLLTCNIYDNQVIRDIDLLKQTFNINIRYSLDQTGDNDDDRSGNWVLESNNIDVKAEYFTDDIDNWNNTLFYSGSARHTGYIKDGHVFIYGKIGTKLIATNTPIDVSLTDVSFKQVFLYGGFTNIVSTIGDLYTVTFYSGYGSHNIIQDSDISNIEVYCRGSLHEAVLTTEGQVYVKGTYYHGTQNSTTTASNWTHLDFSGETITDVFVTSSKGTYAITDTNKLYVADYALARWLFSNLNLSGTVPQNVLDNVKQITISPGYGLAAIILSTDGDVYTLGRNSPNYRQDFNTIFGQSYGSSYTTNRKFNGSFDSSYKMIDGSGNKVTQVAYSAGRGIALHEDTTVTIWGDVVSNNMTASRIHVPQKLTTSNGGSTDVSGILAISAIERYKSLFLTNDGKLFWVGSLIVDYKDLSVTYNGSWYGATTHYDATNDSATNHTNQKIEAGVTTMANAIYNIATTTSSESSSDDTDVCNFTFNGDVTDVSYCAASVVYVSLNTFRSMFQFRTSEISDGSLNSTVFDSSSADIQYDVSFSLFPDINVMNTMMDTSLSEGIVYQSANPYSNIVKYDFMYYLAKKLFGTIQGVAFFNNKSSIISSLETLGENYLNSIKNTLEIADNSGNGLTNTTTGSSNIVRRLLQQVQHFQPTRLDVSSSGISNVTTSQPVPFHEGDTISLFITVNTTENQHELTGTTEIPGRVYRIKMYLTEDSSLTNTIT